MTTHAHDPYPSRRVDRPLTVQRAEPVVHGTEDDGPLTREQLDAFDDRGLLQLSELFSSVEVHAMAAELERLADDADVHADAGTIVDPDTGGVRSIFRIPQFSDVFDRVVRDHRTAGAARQILGSEVSLHHTRVNDKPGFGGSGFHWHSDFETWHTEDGMPTPRCVSASILLTDNHGQNGPLLLIPGSQSTFVACVGTTPERNWESSLEEQVIGLPDQESIERQYDEHGLHVATGGAGTVILFDSNTLHASNGNMTPDRRSNVFAVYNSVENTLVEPFAAPGHRPEFLASRDVTPLKPLD